MAQNHQTLREWHNAIARDPSNPTNYRARGTVYGQLGYTHEALADFSTAIQLDPSDTDSLYRRGMLHLTLGDRTSASGDLAEVIRLNPGHTEARYQLGLIRGGVNFSYQQTDTTEPTFAWRWLPRFTWRNFIYLLLVVATVAFVLTICSNDADEKPEPESSITPDLSYIEQKRYMLELINGSIK